MDRRNFLTVALGVAGACAALAVPAAHAMPVAPAPAGTTPHIDTGVATPEDIEAAKVEKAWYYWRRRRWYRRRYYWRPRYRYYRRRYYWRPRIYLW